MAYPQPSAKQPVKLAPDPASPGPRVSKIRRDPPPAVKPKQLNLDPEDRDQWTVIVGVMTFALAIFFIILGFSSYSGRPSEGYAVEVRAVD